jgi:hypothetical protein
MSRSAHTEAQIIAAVKQVESGSDGRGGGSGGGSIQAHHLRLEAEVQTGAPRIWARPRQRRTRLPQLTPKF